MLIHFYKMHGAGNDFVVIEDLSNEIELSAAEAARACDRHFGIGADGLILVRPPVRAGCLAYMHYLNADGSLAEICGNGLRCMSKFLVDQGFASALPGPERRFLIETRAGVRAVGYETDDAGRMTSATVDMGRPRFSPEAIPTSLAATTEVAVSGGGAAPAAAGGGGVTGTDATAAASGNVPASEAAASGNVPASANAPANANAPAAPGAPADATAIGTPGTGEPAVVGAILPSAIGDLSVTCVNMGNPHAVCFLTEQQAAILSAPDGEFAAVAAPLERHAAFPEHCNIEFVQLLNAAAEPDGADLAMRVYERGSGETLACGSGACAVAVAAAVNGLGGRQSRVRLRGGLLDIDWQEGGQVLMTGPAETSFEGDLQI